VAPRVVLQPSGGRAALKHFSATILHSVSVGSLRDHLADQELGALIRLFPTGETRIWGVTPGDGGRNKRKWEKIEPGDVAAFCGHGEVFSHATIRYKLHSPTLARALWGQDSDGQTWEYVYFVGEPLNHSIRYERLAEALGFSRDFVVLGFTVLNPEQSAVLINQFGLHGD